MGEVRSEIAARCVIGVPIRSIRQRRNGYVLDCVESGNRREPDFRAGSEVENIQQRRRHGEHNRTTNFAYPLDAYTS